MDYADREIGDVDVFSLSAGPNGSAYGFGGSVRIALAGLAEGSSGPSVQIELSIAGGPETSLTAAKKALLEAALKVLRRISDADPAKLTEMLDLDPNRVKQITQPDQ